MTSTNMSDWRLTENKEMLNSVKPKHELKHDTTWIQYVHTLTT